MIIDGLRFRVPYQGVARQTGETWRAVRVAEMTPEREAEIADAEWRRQVSRVAERLKICGPSTLPPEANKALNVLLEEMELMKVKGAQDAP